MNHENNHGGRREGAGRKKLAVPTKSINFRLDAAAEEKVRAYVKVLKELNFKFTVICSIPVYIHSSYSAETLAEELTKFFKSLNNYQNIFLQANVEPNDSMDFMLSSDDQATTYLCKLYFLDNAPLEENISSNSEIIPLIAEHCKKINVNLICFGGHQFFYLPN